jgi:hypothetical protein
MYVCMTKKTLTDTRYMWVCTHAYNLHSYVFTHISYTHFHMHAHLYASSTVDMDLHAFLACDRKGAWRITHMYHLQLHMCIIHEDKSSHASLLIFCSHVLCGFPALPSNSMEQSDVTCMHVELAYTCADTCIQLYDNTLCQCSLIHQLWLAHRYALINL